MRVLLSWLREHVEIPYSVAELEERLPMLGLGIEGAEFQMLHSRLGEAERVDDDAVLDLEIPANRGDLMSLLGVARELAAAARTRVKLSQPAVVEEGPPISEVTRVEVRDPARCPRFTARMIVDVTVAPSPSWLARRLEACGVRSINNIVDVTNYAMLLLGQPMHAFDHDRLIGGRLIVRLARPGETLMTLDGVDRVLDADTLVVADAERPGGIAGIIGGASTEITAQTRGVLLEAASWQPAMIRRTSRRLGVRTESSARFERGIDVAGIQVVQDFAIGLMRELAGGRVLRGMIDVYPQPLPVVTVDLRWPRVARILGVEVPQGEGVAILRSLGFEVHDRDGAVQVRVPTFRRDVEREEDLIEEVARHYGYEKIPGRLPVETMAQGSRAASLDADEAVRMTLVRAGLTEALTVSLTNRVALEGLRLSEEHPWRTAAPLRNPMVEDHTHLRTTLLPGLLNAARVNVSRGVRDVQIFELGRTFHPAGGGVVERRRLALLMTGSALDGAWNLPAEAVTVGFYHLKGVVEALLGEMRIQGAEFTGLPAGGESLGLMIAPWLHPGRAAQLTITGEGVGTLGELHPDVAARYDLPAGVYLADLDLEAVLRRAVLQPRFAALPRFPAVRRDIALVLPQDVPSARVEATIREAGGALLETLDLFDVYQEAPIPAGHRNLAYALTFRSPERTLAADEVDAVVGAIGQALKGRLRAKIRE